MYPDNYSLSLYNWIVNNKDNFWGGLYYEIVDTKYGD